MVSPRDGTNNGPALAKRPNNAAGRFPTRPEGATQMIQYGVGALNKCLAISGASLKIETFAEG
jgi:hypothetical protein